MICYRLFDAKFKDSECFKRKKRKNLLSHFEEDYYKKSGLNLLYQKGEGGLIINIHGGGFAYGTSLDEDHYIVLLNKLTKMHVISADYSLSYKASCPSQIYEIIDQVEYIINKYPEIDRNKIIIMGHSAGANLSAAVTIFTLEKKCSFHINKLILDYPCLDNYISPEKRESQYHNFSYAVMKQYSYKYAGGSREMMRNPLCSPLYVSDETLSKFPPTFLVACEKDLLKCDVYKFSKRLNSHHVFNIVKETNQIHGFVEIYLRSYDFIKPKNSHQKAALEMSEEFAKFILGEQEDE